MRSPEVKSPAAVALGPLFRLTEVHLWGEKSGEVREALQFEESLVSSCTFWGGRKNPSLSSELSDSSPMEEDVELIKQLSELGLPISFNTSKEVEEQIEKEKHEKKVNQHIRFEVLEEIDDLPALSVDDGNSICCTAQSYGIDETSEALNMFCNGSGTNSGPADTTLDLTDSILDRMTGVSRGGEILERSCLVNDDEVGSGEVECVDLEHSRDVGSGEVECVDLEHSRDVVSEVVVESDTALFEQFTDSLDSSLVGTSGEWMALWHDFYRTTYYYNVQTGESTWDPPPKIETNLKSQDNEMSTADTQSDLDRTNLEPSSNLQAPCSIQEPEHVGNPLSQLIEIEEEQLPANNFNTFIRKRKKKLRKKARSTNSSMEISELYNASEDASSDVQKGVITEDSPRISKYWYQRYLLFSKFDNGIKMDEEGWFSVTPEAIAKHHALRCGVGSVIDLFAGVGGNAIQFAQRCKHVIAIDIDPEKIDYAQHNAAIYGVEDNIDFIQGDSFSLASKLKADVVFMSPPWGGPAYSKFEKFDMRTMLKPHDGLFLFNVAKKIAPKIVMFLPRNVDIDQLAEISLSSSPPWSLEVEKNLWNGRVKAVTAYFSEPSTSIHIEDS